jgi:hypothetical protein
VINGQVGGIVDKSAHYYKEDCSTSKQAVYICQRCQLLAGLIMHFGMSDPGLSMTSRFMDYKRIIEAVFDDEPTLPCTLIYDVNKTRVYRVDVPKPVIVRVAEGDSTSYAFQAALL